MTGTVVGLQIAKLGRRSCVKSKQVQLERPLTCQDETPYINPEP